MHTTHLLQVHVEDQGTVFCVTYLHFQQGLLVSFALDGKHSWIVLGTGIPHSWRDWFRLERDVCQCSWLYCLIWPLSECTPLMNIIPTSFLVFVHVSAYFSFCIQFCSWKLFYCYSSSKCASRCTQSTVEPEGSPKVKKQPSPWWLYTNHWS